MLGRYSFVVAVSLSVASLGVKPAFADSCSSADGGQVHAQTVAFAGKPNIVEVATSAGQFNTLAAALEAANLVETLQGPGPFTVFAPTDEAFAKLPAGTVENLLKPENREQLVAVLTYHVSSGRQLAKDVIAAGGAISLQGQKVDLTRDSDGAKIDKAKLIRADVEASNGVIHVIDQVILPESKNLVEVAADAGAFKTLLTAATEAGLAETLATKGPFTIFAPTDEAFAKLPEGTIAHLLKPENRSELQAILKLHVVEGRAYASQVLKSGKAKSLTGKQLNIAVRSGKPMVAKSGIVSTDIDASNGVVHVIDRVILPSDVARTPGY